MEDSKDTQTIRIWKRTLIRLRAIAQETDEPMVLILDRMVAEEEKRLRKKHTRGEK